MRYDLYLKLLKLIPKGKVISYKDFSRMTGLPLRVATRVLKENKDVERFPCFKVIRSNGKVGGYSLGVNEKIRRLKEEVVVSKGEVDKKYFWKINYELIWKKFEKMVREEVKIRNPKINRIAAVDTHDKTCAVVFEEGKLVEKRCIKIKEKFSYIPGFFFLREGYPTIKVLEKINFDVALIDAHGLAHPRECGLATFVGVIIDKPTIGVAKRYLYGKIKDGKIFVNRKQVGIKYKNLYVSIGNLVSIKNLEVVKKFRIIKKMIEPIYIAHKLSNAY